MNDWPYYNIKHVLIHLEMLRWENSLVLFWVGNFLMIFISDFGVGVLLLFGCFWSFGHRLIFFFRICVYAVLILLFGFFGCLVDWFVFMDIFRICGLKRWGYLTLTRMQIVADYHEERCDKLKSWEFRKLCGISKKSWIMYISWWISCLGFDSLGTRAVAMHVSKCSIADKRLKHHTSYAVHVQMSCITSSRLMHGNFVAPLWNKRFAFTKASE